MATKKKTTNHLSKKPEWTINEFKMWLHGAYSLQGENWVPNAEQWAMILDIIYKLKDGNKAGASPQVMRGPVLAPLGYGGQPPLAPPPVLNAGGSALDAVSEPQRTQGTTNGVPAGEKIITTGQFE
ncbi:hypothetical protein Xoosp13_235 [Xanthomonas phage Xoo-sp13]|nr:hypothetical protein Xoosp13_235 [Xanthomonas phage Xoo-sp13]